jgi:hypothetical protein
MPISKTSFRHAFANLVEKEARARAGEDAFVSKADQKSDAGTPEARWVDEMATESRAFDVQGRASVKNTVERALNRADLFLAGAGDEVDQNEIDRLRSTSPAMGAVALRAFQLAGGAPQAGPMAAADAQTLADWKRVPELERREVVQNEGWGAPHLTESGFKAISELPPEHQDYARRIVDDMKANGNVEVQDDGYVRVGGLDISVNVLTLPDGDVAGAQVHVRQHGAGIYDDSGYFDTFAEAEAAGFEDTDVSWSNSGAFDHDGSALSYGDYMEWTGH